MSYNARITSFQVHLGRLPESEVKVSFAHLCQTPSDPWTVAARLLCLWDSLLKLRFLISKTVSVMRHSEKYMPYWVTVKIKRTYIPTNTQNIYTCTCKYSIFNYINMYSVYMNTYIYTYIHTYRERLPCCLVFKTVVMIIINDSGKD